MSYTFYLFIYLEYRLFERSIWFTYAGGSKSNYRPHIWWVGVLHFLHAIMGSWLSRLPVMEPGVLKKTLPRPIFSNPILGNPNGISNFMWYLDFFFLYLWHMVYQGKSFESLEECGLGGGIMYNAIYVWYLSIHNRKFYLILFYHLKKPLYQLYNTIL